LPEGALNVALAQQIKRLVRHSAIYGVGGLIQRLLAVLLLPLYLHYLSPSDYGTIETLVALTAITFTLLRAGIQNAFFRFYFDSDDPGYRRRIVRTSFWSTMTAATAALLVGLALSEPISEWLFDTGEHADLVAAAFVGLWATMNYDQLTALFRVEERSVSFSIASLANVVLTIAVTVLLVVVLDKGPIGVIVGNFSGTLAVWVALLAYRRYTLGLEFDGGLFRRMVAFGWPFVPSAVAVSAIDFNDRFFLVKLSGAADVGRYALGVRIAAALVFLLWAFRLAWPAFAYSIRDDDEARRTYGFVLTYVVLVGSWAALTLGLLSPWLVELLGPPDFHEGSRVVAPLSFAAVAFGAYVVVVIAIGRARRMGPNVLITGVAAALNVLLNILLIPPYGIVGAASATLAAYVTMFALMTWNAQRVFHVPYQWRRLALAAGTAVALTVAGKLLDVNLPAAIALALVYPLALLLLGFYLPAERQRIGALGRRVLAAAR
jgi:O-antigen/teichoic acid export membrane protein